MANNEDVKDTSARLLAIAAVGAGAGTALYKGFGEAPGSLQRVVDAVQGGTSVAIPKMMVRAPIQDMSRILSEGFGALEDTMSPGGMAETLRRSYERALYASGVVAGEDRGRITAKLVKSSQNWETFQSTLKTYEHQLGGLEGLHSAMREIAGGTVRGQRGKELAQLIQEMPNISADEQGRRGGYLKSAFEEGGQFWKDRFRLEPEQVRDTIPTRAVSPRGRADAFKLEAALDHQFEIVPGVRDANRPRAFADERSGNFAFKVAGEAGDVRIPYTELRFNKPQDALSDNRWFLSTPTAVEHRGINFVAADHRGMGFASVPHFAVPKAGGGVEIMSWNKGLNLMLHGDGSRGIEGLAQKLQKLHGDERAQRQLTWDWNTKIRGMFHRVTGSQENLAQARMQSESVVPIKRLLAEMSGETVDSSMESLLTSYDEIGTAVKEYAKETGRRYEIGPLAGADPMAQQHRFAMRDWSKRWDIFGEDYAIERRYASRIKPFEMHPDAVKAMENMPLGKFNRGYGITSTAAMRAETSAMPQVSAYLTLGKARHFGEEEAVISSKVKDMMKMRTTQKFEVLAGTTEAGVGEALRGGVPIGVDYRTGETIVAKSSRGMVEQKIIDARQVGDIVRLEVETTLPLQDQMKIFGYKAQVQVARESISKELMHEWGAGQAGLRFSKDLEFVGHADLMKKIPQEMNKQMAEATFLIMQKRLQEANVLQSGGRGRVKAQKKARLAGKKQYTWSAKHSRPQYKGALPKDYVNMNMVMFVRDEQHREKILRGRQKAGTRLARRLGMAKEQEAFGTGLEMLKYAKRQGMDSEELGLIGGAFYRQLVSTVGNETEAHRLLKEAGVSKEDIRGLREAKGVLAMPTMHVGGYASFSADRWGRAGMDYRALMELKAQRWGEAGDLLVGEIARRVMPAQNLVELEKAALSITGRAGELPEDIERITSIREAREALGEKPFVFDYGDKEVYVPRADASGVAGARGMGQFAAEPGDVRNQELRSAYEQYFRAQKSVRDFPGEKSDKRLEAAIGNLERKIHKGWAAAGSLRGKVVGTAGPVVRRRVPSRPEDTLARVFGAKGMGYEQAAEQFVKASDKVFTVGITRETGEKMFRDLMSKASGEELDFLKTQQEAFLSGKKVTGFAYRHPTHRPQSLLPAWFEMVEGRGESVQFYKATMEHGDRVLDVSFAAGTKADYDFDHIQVGFIADEKVKVSLDQLMNSRAYREQFLQGLSIQQDIMKRVKDAAAAGISEKNVEGYVAGLQRLVGVKLETGRISNLVGEMRAAAAFQADGEQFRIASYLLAELEEGPISSKHGLHVGEMSTHLREFVRDEGVGVRGAMRDAWDRLLKEGTFEAGKIKYSREEFIDNMSNWISSAEESGNLAAYRNIARLGAQAQKGKEYQKLTMEMLSSAIDSHRGGRGDLNAALSRQMRMGPGSGLSTSRGIMNSLQEVASTAARAFKKHWKYPAAGVAAAVGISALGGGSMSMKDHSPSVDALGGGPAVPHISAPMMNPNRIITGGGGAMPVGYGMQASADIGGQGLRQIATLAGESGASVRIRDDRGAITPEYIDKVSRERYY